MAFEGYDKPTPIDEGEGAERAVAPARRGVTGPADAGRGRLTGGTVGERGVNVD
jgi:hypothetical protein